MIDTHCHLNDSRLVPEFEQIVNAFPDKSIEAVVNVGYDMPSSEIALKQAHKDKRVFAAVGVHPHDAKSVTKHDYIRLKEMCGDKRVVAFGEVGLDYYYDHSPRETQREVFKKMLDIVQEVNLPVIIHVRDAFMDCIDILTENRRKITRGGIIHCYSGSYESAEIFIKLGFHIAFGGAITYKNNTSSAGIIQKLPLDRILAETDCPYLSPVPYRGKTNEPAYVLEVIKRIAEVRGMTVEDIDRITTENAVKLFGLKI